MKPAEGEDALYSNPLRPDGASMDLRGEASMATFCSWGVRLACVGAVLSGTGAAGADEIPVGDPDPCVVKPQATRTLPPEPSPGTESASIGETQRIAGLAIGGVGVTGMVLGVVAIFEARSSFSDAQAACPLANCSPSRVQSVRFADEWATISDASLVAGAVALVTGAIVFFTAPRAATGTSVAMTVGPAPEGAVLSAAGRF
jgi:hypothetical protein